MAHFSSKSLLAPLAAAVVAAAATACVDVNAAPDDFAVGNHAPDDWRDEVIYQVLVDRFANGDRSNDYRVNLAAPARYHGGDWKGLADRLDYVQALGVTTIWISPIVKNVETDAGIDSYHGYWTQDPFALNPHFGNLDDLRDLVSKIHARKMRVILDIVTNHMGQLFYYDINMNGRPDESVEGGIKTCPKGKPPCETIHLTEYDPDYEAPVVQSFTSLGNAGPAPIVFFHDASINRMPPAPHPEDPVLDQWAKLLGTPEAYHRRGRIVNYDLPPDGTEQTMFGDFPGGLKDLATERPDIRQAMADAYGRWITLADLDGFRIDTVKHVEHEFWQQWGGAIRQTAKRAHKEKFFMFGEVFDGRDDLVGSYAHNKEMDGLFDFPQYFQVFQDVFLRGQGTTKIEGRWSERRRNWSTDPNDSGVGIAPADMHVNFLDNHDVGRFLWAAAKIGGMTADLARQTLRNALSFLMTEDGVPCVYYGTEQEFSGGNDPANREDLWISDYKTSGDTFKHIQRLTRVRKGVSALRRGAMKFVWTTDHVGTEPDAGLVAFERKDDASYALVVVNTSRTQTSKTESATGAMAVAAPDGELVDVLPASGGATFSVSGGKVSVTVPPMSAVILIPSSAPKP